MAGEFRSQIDWTQPWLQPYRVLGERVAIAPDWVGYFNVEAARQGITNAWRKPIRFIPQSDLPAGVPYEGHIAETGGVPTRDNLHDFFNALVWLHFPVTKARLNQLQFEQLTQARQGQEYCVGGTRGQVRDAATILDENGALLLDAGGAVAQALKNREWLEPLFHQRDDFGRRWGLVLFGHALMEKLVRPYKAITAHSLLVSDAGLQVGAIASATRQAIDMRTAADLSAAVDTSRFIPLPVLGVPGWHAAQDEAFYRDQAIFRAPRK